MVLFLITSLSLNIILIVLYVHKSKESRDNAITVKLMERSVYNMYAEIVHGGEERTVEMHTVQGVDNEV